MADTDGPYGQMSGAERGRLRTEPLTADETRKREILLEIEHTAQRIRERAGADFPFSYTTRALIYEIAELRVDQRTLILATAPPAEEPAETEVLFPDGMGYLLAVGIFAVAVMVTTVYGLIVHRAATTAGFFAGIVAGVFITLSIGVLIKAFRSKTEWLVARGEAFSGEIVETGKDDPDG